ncbi:helix-turn-helix domain-containing protein [Kushneria aurantia]|uniref:Helix-turn-helix domain-containing protein n=1 Tax=Kushneria aurantia TaxID=504092 RepID=A0ABV6G4A5_9GAMM|nr:helix-turn-helix transcriptional regulator [Kushneria aurantia]
MHTNGNSHAERPSVLVHVATNLRKLRQRASLSQQALAESADVSRRMLVNIESGDVNVSLNVLDRLAEVLGVQLYALVQPPESEDSARIEQLVWAGRHADSRGILLASKPAHQEVELSSWWMASGDRYDSEPNPPGWHDMVVVIAGELTLMIDGEARRVVAGDFHVVASDQPISYCNEGAAPLHFVRNVLH